MKSLICTFLSPFCIYLIFILLFTSCQSADKNNALKQGETLAKTHCAGCHLLPDPALLDKKTWEDGVLPAMAVQFGIEVLQGNIYLNNKNSALSNHDWLQIINYYKSLAPDSLVKSQPIKINQNDWAAFKLKKPANDPLVVSGTLMTAINPLEKAIYTSDVNNPGLYQWSQKLKPTLITPLTSSAVNIIFNDSLGQKVITCMGGMRALDITKGDIISLVQNKKGSNSNRLIGADFIRPIQSQPIDFNKDGLVDYVICSFGHNKGGLYLLKQLPDKTFDKIIIREIPGATQSVTGDFNQDGWPDIIALFAHGDEGIWLFLNDKKGGFDEKNLLRFPPVYGSSSFQMVDMNKDGKLDIVYTAGDNSDYSRISKPYHGLYIFINHGDFMNTINFKKSYFQAVNGCTKAIAADFDQDGDLDIASIAFFADFKNNPSQTFVYFENENKKLALSFKPHILPVYKNGRWICMDAGDVDGDGDEDIVLGNYSKGFFNEANFKPNWDVHTPFVILENQTK